MKEFPQIQADSQANTFAALMTILNRTAPGGSAAGGSA